MKRLLVGVVLFCCMGSAVLAADDPAMREARAVLKKMTLEEKVSILSGNGTMSVNAIPRVGINKEWVMSDNSHTVRGDMARWDWGYVGKGDESTVLPTCSALASTWNVAFAAAHGDVLGAELRNRDKDMLLGPGMNIMRTPLCGRNWEYMTEDPCLAAKLVVPLIRGIQKYNVAACAKHYAVNSQEWNRNGVDTHLDERTLREIYLPAFRAAVEEAGVLSVMNAYNKIRGTFCSENDYLQKKILREEWGFKGLVVTDWGAQHSTVAAAKGGTDLEMNRGRDIRYYNNPMKKTQPLVDAVKTGKVSAETVDEMALHVLYTMARCGMFDGRDRGKGSRNTAAHQMVARRIGEEAVTLLKNDAEVLPLNPKAMKSILVVGNLAVAEHTRKGWSAEGKPLYEITPFKGLQERLGKDVKLIRAPLVASDEKVAIHAVAESSIGTFDTSVKDAGMSVRAWKLAFWNNRDQSGAPVANQFMRTLNVDWKCNDPASGAKAGKFSARWTTQLIPPETGIYVLATRSDRRAGTRITVDGKVVANDWDGKNSNLSFCAVALKKGVPTDVAVDYRTGDSESTCFFGWQLPSERGMSLSEVEAAARKVDAVLVFTGTEIGHGRAMECEGADRPDLRLPVGHDEAIAKILSWKLPKTVVINHSGAPMEFPWLDACPTLVQQPYLGQEAGRALAAVLFGDVNPSGKLPCTWPKSLADCPVQFGKAYNKDSVTYSEGIYVGYRWYDKRQIVPMFPFGYGLSYTKFDYGTVRVSAKQFKAGESITVEVDVKNIGDRAGKEIVQLYVAPQSDSAPDRPIRELRAFDKVLVPAGGTVTAKMTITPRDLSFYDVEAHAFRSLKGTYTLCIGASSRDIRATVPITLTDAWSE